MQQLKKRARRCAWSALLSASLGAFAAAVGAVQQPPRDKPPEADQLAALMEEGEAIFSSDCAACHGAEGGAAVGPALSGNGALINKEHVIRQILEGLPERGMPPFAPSLKDRQVAAVGTFIRNAWENSYGIVLEADVKPIRAAIKKH